MPVHPTDAPLNVPLADATMWAQSPIWQRTLANFDLAANLIALNPDSAARLRRPERVTIVSVPVRMDRGHVEVFTGYRVQHNDSAGPYKGGIRYAPTLDLGEVCSLAMQMTWKTALMGLPLGGAKGGVTVDPLRLSPREVQELTRRYTTEIFPLIGPERDIPAPDMGTNEQHMSWMMDTYSARVGYTTPGVVTGKPIYVGGSLLRREATGRGVVFCIEEACRQLNLSMQGLRYSVHGFGNVGSAAALELHRRGAVAVAAADISGAYLNPKGLDIPAMARYAEKNRGLAGYDAAEHDEDPCIALYQPCDALIPAAQGNVITKDNAQKLRCRILAEGANAPTMVEADTLLQSTDMFIIPDVLCNAGGVIVSYFEWVQGGMHFFWNAEEIEARLKQLLREAFARTMAESRRLNVPHRMASLALAVGRVDQVMCSRGLFA